MGTIGRAYDAPRVKAERIDVLGRRRRARSPLELRRRADRGARVATRPRQRHRDRASRSSAIAGGPSAVLGPDRVVVTGLAGARIPATALVEGRTATVVGIVRRPYPGATDRRWSIVPRSRGRRRHRPRASRRRPAATSRIRHAGPGGAGASRNAVRFGPPRTSTSSISAGHVGQIVRVGGLVAELARRRLPARRRDGRRAGRPWRGRGRVPAAPRAGRRPQRHRPGRGARRHAARSWSTTRPGSSASAIPTLDAADDGHRSGRGSPCRSANRGPRSAPGAAGSPADCSGRALRAVGRCSESCSSRLVSVAVTVLRRRRTRRLQAARMAARLAERSTAVAGARRT